MNRRKRRFEASRKIVDETAILGRPRRGAVLKEEVWVDDAGSVVKYSLAYINPLVCAGDNGRVLGYDNSHGYHHRHFMGSVARIRFNDYETLAQRFREEVRELWRREDEKDRIEEEF